MEHDARHLYHFTPFDDDASRSRVERLLLQNLLPTITPAEMSDPFDSLAYAVFDPTEDGLRRMVRDAVERDNPGLDPAKRAMEVSKLMRLGYAGNAELEQELARRFTAEVRTSMGLTRFMSTADNAITWQLHGAAHTGLALQFERRDLLSEVQPVHYQDERPKIPCTGAFTGLEAREALLVRCADWAYEEEWRIVHTTGQGGNSDSAFDPLILISLVMGFAMPMAKKRELAAMVGRRPYPVKLYQTVPHPEGYTLAITPFKL